jgi:hypothetical protein
VASTAVSPWQSLIPAYALVLIVLNSGLPLGVISSRLFAMMIPMALATTMATAPILRRLVPNARRASLT